MSHVHALLLCGLSYNGSTQATLFTDRPIDPSTIPAGLSPLSASTQIVARLAPGGISGATAKLEDLCSPLIAAATPAGLLQDDATGTFSTLFAPDPGYLNTDRWVIENVVRVEKADTTLTLTGPTAPTVNQLVWLNNECLKIASVSTAALVHTCGVTRGQCGSRAMCHGLDPESYPDDGDNGARQALTVYSRQSFERATKIEAALYTFRMSTDDPEAVSSAEWVWYGYLGERPKQNDEMNYAVEVQHFTSALNEAVIKGGVALELSHCVEIVETTLSLNPGSLVTRNVPESVAFRLTIYEFEKLFNEAIHVGQGETIDSTLFDDIKDDLATQTTTQFEFDCEVGGYRWIWRAAYYQFLGSTDGYPDLVRVGGSWTASEPGASFSDSEAVFPAEDGFTTRREQHLNQGFVRRLGSSISPAEYRVRTAQGEAPPKVSLRLRLQPLSFGQAALRLSLSHHGDGSNDATYDTIAGGRGLGFNPSWVNVGSAPADPFTVDTGTQAWLEYDALHSDLFEYGFFPGDKIGDWFRNELLLRSSILAFVPTTGKLGPRQWARVPSSIATLVPVADMPVAVDQTLKELKALYLERGLDPVTLTAQVRKPLQLEGARAQDTKDAPTIRIWRTGSHHGGGGLFSDAELSTGPLAELERATFGQTLGQPRVFPIPVANDCGLQFADIVYWTDPSIPTATGRGLTTRRMIVLGLDRRTSDGYVIAYCQEDVLGLHDQILGLEGQIGSGLTIAGILDLNTTERTAELWVEGLAVSQGFRGDSSDASLWTSIKNATGHIRITYHGAHNPFQAKERRGSVEFYAQLTALSYDSGLRRTVFTISWATTQTTSRGLSAADIIRIGATVHLPDQRPSTATPGGIVLTQVSDISADDTFRVIVSATSRRQRFDGRRTLLSQE